MNITVDLPKDTLMVSRDDLKNVIRELVSEIQAEQTQDDIMNIKEVSEYLKVSQSTLRAMIATNEIPHYKRGSVIRLCRADVLEWVKNGGKTA